MWHVKKFQNKNKNSQP